MIKKKNITKGFYLTKTKFGIKKELGLIEVTSYSDSTFCHCYYFGSEIDFTIDEVLAERIFLKKIELKDLQK